MNTTIERWLSESGYARNTERQYRLCLSNIQEWADRNRLTLEGIDEERLKQFFEDNGCTFISQRHHLYALRAYLKWALPGREHAAFEVRSARSGSVSVETVRQEEPVDEQIERWLAQSRYAKDTERQYRGCLNSIRKWAKEQGLTVEQLNEQRLDRFFAEHVPARRHQRHHFYALRAYIKWAVKGREHPLLDLKFLQRMEGEEPAEQGRAARVDEVMELWLAESGYADGTKQGYRNSLLKLKDFAEENGLSVEQLDGQKVEMYLKQHDYSHNHKRLYYNAMRAYMKWLGHGTDHPIFRTKLPKNMEGNGRALTKSEIRQLLESLPPTSPANIRNKAIIALMVDTGVRAAELCQIELSKLNMFTRKFTVLVKRNRMQEKVFSTETAYFLERWLEIRDEHALRGVRELFVSVGGNKPGTAMMRHGLRVEFRKMGQEAGIGHITPHDMRRTMATLLTEAGAPTRLVQLLGGWENIKMVELYTRRLHIGQMDRFSAVRSIMLEQ